MSMSQRPAGSRGMTCFRLSAVPAAIRERGKTLAIKQSDSFAERVRIGLAAEQPSDRLYWIPSDAWERVMRPRKART